MPNKDRDKYNEYMRDYILRRYHRRMEEAREKLGGKCVKCDSPDNLELDHIDPASKTISIAKVWSCTDDKFQAELEKCQLLCRKCHQAKTLIDLGQQDARSTHGTLSSYRYCKCELCRAAKSAYSKTYQKTHPRNRKKPK